MMEITNQIIADGQQEKSNQETGDIRQLKSCFYFCSGLVFTEHKCEDLGTGTDQYKKVSGS